MKHTLLIISLLFSTYAFAGSAKWSSSNIQYLYGSSYELGDDERSVVTIEHVNAWKFGDNFFFVDVTNSDRAGNSTPTEFYGEFSPRFSLSSISGKKLSVGIIKDVLVTTTLEMGQGFRTYLYGLAVDLDIFKMPVAQVNYYIRNEVGTSNDLGSQLTLVWLKPFKIASSSLVFEGFFDYAFGNDPKADNIITGPRLLLDVGNFFGSADKFQFGIEHQMWRNKFGIDGVDEDVTQLMVKWIW